MDTLISNWFKFEYLWLIIGVRIAIIKVAMHVFF